MLTLPQKPEAGLTQPVLHLNSFTILQNQKAGAVGRLDLRFPRAPRPS